MRSKTKYFLFSTLFIFAFFTSSISQATVSRTAGLGYLNKYVKDDVNIWLFPHAVHENANLVNLELTGLPNSNPLNDSGNPVLPLSATHLDSVHFANGGGAIIGINKELTLGMWFSDYENAFVSRFLTDHSLNTTTSFVNQNFGANTIQNANRKFDFFAAYNLEEVTGMNSTVGLHIIMGSSDYYHSPDIGEKETTQNPAKERDQDYAGETERGFGLGFGSQINDFISFDSGFQWISSGLNFKPNNVAMIDETGGSQVDLHARAFIGLDEKWEIVPALSLSHQSFAGTAYYNLPAGQKIDKLENVFREKDSSNQVDISSAIHLKANDHLHWWGVVGALLTHYQYFHENLDGLVVNNIIDRDFDSFPYFKSGIEGDITSWLQLRFGVVKYLFSQKDSVTGASIKTNSDGEKESVGFEADTRSDEPLFKYFVGVTGHYKNFFVDGVLDPMFFERGPYLVSGAGSNLFLKTSLGFHF